MKLTFGGDRQVREHLALAAKHAVARAQIEDILRDKLHPIPGVVEDFSRDRDLQMLERNARFHGGRVSSHLEAALMDESAPKFLENPDAFLSGSKAQVTLSDGSYTTRYYETAPLGLFQSGNHDLRRGLDIPDTFFKDISKSTRQKAVTQWMHTLGMILYEPYKEVPLQDRLPMPLQGAVLRVLSAVEKHLGMRLMLPMPNGAKPLADVFRELWSNPYHQHP